MEEGLLCMGQPALAGVAIVVRHGARSPNKGEMKPFTASSPIRTQWYQAWGDPTGSEPHVNLVLPTRSPCAIPLPCRHRDDGGPADYEAENNLTDSGRDQMRAIGSYFAAHPRYIPLIKRVCITVSPTHPLIHSTVSPGIPPPQYPVSSFVSYQVQRTNQERAPRLALVCLRESP